MPAVLEADFDCVLSLDPGQIVGKLPAIVGQESELPPPVLTDGVVGNGALEIDQRRSSRAVEKSATCSD